MLAMKLPSLDLTTDPFGLQLELAARGPSANPLRQKHLQPKNVRDQLNKLVGSYRQSKNQTRRQSCVSIPNLALYYD
jgi:hypothetical protein